MQAYLCNSYLEIDSQILRKNYRSIRSVLPEHVELIPVLKGDAYGFGAVNVARIMQEEGAETFAVAQICEAVELLDSGINGEMLVLAAFPAPQLSTAVERGIMLTVFTPDMVTLVEKEAKAQNKRAGVHIKIETGLNRIGVKPGKDLDELIKALKECSHVDVRGVYSHFIDGEINNSPLAVRQFGIYKEALKQFEAAGIDVPVKHMCNSGASEWYNDAYLDAVRIGRRLYMDSRDYALPAGSPGTVEEAASWRTSITALRTVEPGESVGYDEKFIAKRPTAVATICIGYGDGLIPDFADAGSPVLINGKLAKYIGVYMDQSSLDVTGIDCSVGDEVTVFGRASDGSFLSAQVLAKTVNHEGVFFTDRLTKRVERRWK